MLRVDDGQFYRVYRDRVGVDTSRPLGWVYIDIGSVADILPLRILACSCSLWCVLNKR